MKLSASRASCSTALPVGDLVCCNPLALQKALHELFAVAAFRCHHGGLPVIYHGYQLQDDLVAPVRFLARWMAAFPIPGLAGDGSGQRIAAALEMITRFGLSHTRPDFAIRPVRVGNREVPVMVETVPDLPFGRLLRFAKDIDAPQPRQLIAVPQNGPPSTVRDGEERQDQPASDRGQATRCSALYPTPSQLLAGSRDGANVADPRQIRCLIPRFDGEILSMEWKDAIWDKFVTEAPRPGTPSEQQYSDRKLRSRR